jgi:hypothetical protein
MDNRLYERFRNWWDNAEHKAKQKWWLWPVGFSIDLIWHRIYTNTNDFLDTHGASMIASVLASIPTDPVTLAITTGVVIIVGLAVHAYFDTRKVSGKQPNEKAVSSLASLDVRNVPRPLVEYVYNNGEEHLIVTNDGPITMQNVQIGSLTWVEERDFCPWAAIRPLTSGQKDDVRVRMVCQHGPDLPSDSGTLGNFLKQPSSPSMRTVSVLNYEDPNGRKFKREFELTRFSADGRIVWNPGPVMLRD